MLLVSWIRRRGFLVRFFIALLVPQAEGWPSCWPVTPVGCSMFTWDESIPKTLSASPTSQLKVSLGMRAATLRTIELSAKSSCWTSPDIGMITVRGKWSEGYTGGRPLLTQQVNWEFFESFSTIYSDDTQWVDWELIQNLPTTLIKVWSVGKFWNYPQKTHQFAHEVLLWKNSKSSFTNYPECAHHIPWATHQEFFQKIPRTLSTTYSTTYTVISLRVFHETELIESLFWLY